MIAAMRFRRKGQGPEGLIAEFKELCKKKDVKGAKEVLKSGLILNRRDGNEGLTPFHIACSYAPPEVVEFMIEIDSSARDRDTTPWDPQLMTFAGKTCMFLACENGNTPVVKLLIARGFASYHDTMVKSYHGHGTTPLLVAVKKGHEETALELLNSGNPCVKKDSNLGLVHAMTNSGGPLHWAAGQGMTSVILALLRREADINETSEDGTPLMWACSRGQVDTAILLLQHGATLEPELGAVDRRGRPVWKVISPVQCCQLEDSCERLGKAWPWPTTTATTTATATAAIEIVK
jgi:ankyrin repeat protein